MRRLVNPGVNTPAKVFDERPVNARVDLGDLEVSVYFDGGRVHGFDFCI